ncbi:thermonuclease family protein [Microcoleus sp. herbarium8]|uniref:thermonuclease family protein n=1 Tax=Microcoleus sp. herbarium8 TaxID=3055436 RepID=UPI002FD6D4F0
MKNDLKSGNCGIIPERADRARDITTRENLLRNRKLLFSLPKCSFPQLPIANCQLIMLLYRLFAIALCVLLASCQKPEMPQGTIAKVERILSGQTIEVISTADKIALLEQIRLIGIDAPDFQQQPWGEAAKQRLEQLIGGKQVLLESDIAEKDQSDRKLAYLWQDGILLNEQLVKEGYVLASGRSRNTKYQQRLLNAQEWARLMGKGLWNPERALRQTPAEFRQQNQ